MSRNRCVCVIAWLMISIFLPPALPLHGQMPSNEKPLTERQRADSRAELHSYFRRETERLTAEALADIKTAEDWRSRQPVYRQQLFEMLGLDPLPQKTPLEVTVTGRVEHQEFTVEKLHYQSLPGLYVTGNLYLPKGHAAGQRFPAILYVCGHGRVKKDGVSYGNKTHYQHHGGWFARNGYVCLTIDTIQLGEIEGLHHGTYRHHMWWWLNRGYTPAGVEAWNGIRGLDLLAARNDVDSARMGVTGRSGGGAYSWWVAALDPRVKVAVPVAGITSLTNHIVDHCIEGHCDCMFMVNTYRWDFPLLAALVAPRPLLISNTDKDRIFPLDGVVDVYQKTRRIYRLLGAEQQIGLQITEGPHKDTQSLRIHAFQWFDHYLKNSDELIRDVAEKHTDVEKLKVFPKGSQPQDQRVTTIHESFVPIKQNIPVPETEQAWDEQLQHWKTFLKSKVFRGWPREESNEPALKKISGEAVDKLTLQAFELKTQPHVTLPVFVLRPTKSIKSKPSKLKFHVVDEDTWPAFQAALRKLTADHPSPDRPEDESSISTELQRLSSQEDTALIVLVPRGIGPNQWTKNPKDLIHIRRRFALLGQTLDGMRVWDVLQGIQAIRKDIAAEDCKVSVESRGAMAGVVLYASLFANDLHQLNLNNLPTTHRDGPYLLNIRKQMDLPQSLGWAATRTHVRLDRDDDAWKWAKTLDQRLDRPGTGLTIR